jgi:hypothetical protein
MWAIAWIVTIGLTPEAVGNVEASQTTTFCTPQTCPSGVARGIVRRAAHAGRSHLVEGEQAQPRRPVSGRVCGTHVVLESPACAGLVVLRTVLNRRVPLDPQIAQFAGIFAGFGSVTQDAPGRIRTSDPRIRSPLLFH